MKQTVVAIAKSRISDQLLDRCVVCPQNELIVVAQNSRCRQLHGAVNPFECRESEAFERKVSLKQPAGVTAGTVDLDHSTGGVE